MNFGLYKVMDHVYQVRGYDLANISFVKSDTAWIIFDQLTFEEATCAALELVNEHLGEFPIKAVVYSHFHGDHRGGVWDLVVTVPLSLKRLTASQKIDLYFSANNM